MSAANTAEKLGAVTTAEFDRRKNALLRRTRRSGRAAAAWRCTLCQGRIDVELKFDAHDKECGSVGRCRTPGCIHWEDRP